MKTLSLLCLLAVGCVDNAILELEVDLPPNTTDETLYAFLQTRSSVMSDFEEEWATQGLLDGFELGTEPTTQAISIVADPTDYPGDALFRLTFCGTPRCDGIGDDVRAQVRLVVEHPFYSLARTRARWTVPTLPEMTIETPERIERCQVEGCREGTTSSYCREGDGTHFCE